MSIRILAKRNTRPKRALYQLVQYYELNHVNFITSRSYLYVYAQTVFSEFALKYSRDTSSCRPCGPTGTREKNSTRHQKSLCGGWDTSPHTWVSLTALSPPVSSGIHVMVCGCTWSAHRIHIKCIGGFGITTCDARSTNQPTKQLDQPVETCLPVLQPHLSPQTQLPAAGGALSSAIKNKGLAVVSRGFGVKRHRHGSGVDPGREVC